MYYKLVGHKPVLCKDVFEWAKWFDKAERRVALSKLVEDKMAVDVSTVFLGLDHNYGSGPPILFETMIFGGKHSDYQERYCTWEEAEEGHKRAVALVLNVHKLRQVN